MGFRVAWTCGCMLLVACHPMTGDRTADPETRPAGIVAELAVDRARVEVGEQPTFTVTLTNTGEEVVTLVRPGDGSRWGWRTPLVGWSVRSADDPGVEHDKRPVPIRQGRCGNVNTLKAGDVVDLAPGQSMTLDEWISSPELTTPGRYRVVFLYENVPSREWWGVPFKEHDPAAMERVRKSTPCLVASNEVTVTVEG